MKKMLMVFGVFLTFAMMLPALARPAGNSSMIQLYLVEKVPSGEWPTVEDGAWGKLSYNMASGRFVFNGHGLAAGEGYTLINFARVGTEWPASVNVLGDGMANAGGNVHIAGNYAYDQLDPDTTPGSSGAYKIWLVLTSDLADNTLLGWNPTEYLFEAELLI